MTIRSNEHDSRSYGQYLSDMRKTAELQKTETRPKCNTCGRFMRRLKLAERAAIAGNGGGEHTHICKKASFNKRTATWGHPPQIPDIELLYHGTNRNFTSFKSDLDGLIYFTDDMSIATDFAKNAHLRGKGAADSHTPRVVAVHAEVKNPLEIIGGRWTDITAPPIITRAKKEGRDWIVLRAFEDSIPGRSGRSFVNYFICLDPTKIHTIT